jgi:hypothetical protein
MIKTNLLCAARPSTALDFDNCLGVLRQAVICNFVIYFSRFCLVGCFKNATQIPNAEHRLSNKEGKIKKTE